LNASPETFDHLKKDPSLVILHAAHLLVHRNHVFNVSQLHSPNSSEMEGYSNLALLMGQNAELGILRRFSRLNLQNLLYLQAELVHLEADLDQIALADQSSGHPQKSVYSRDWWSLANSKNEGDERQWRTVLEIRGKLKEYSAITPLFLVFGC
jgi:hypothetical protein